MSGTNAHRRATAALRAEQQPRTLLREPRLSKADEQTIANGARRTEQEVARAEVSEAVQRMRRDLEVIYKHIRKAAPGNQRNSLRLVTAGLKGIERAITS
jgi:hypothetical protein